MSVMARCKNNAYTDYSSRFSFLLFSGYHQHADMAHWLSPIGLTDLSTAIDDSPTYPNHCRAQPKTQSRTRVSKTATSSNHKTLGGKTCGTAMSHSAANAKCLRPNSIPFRATSPSLEQKPRKMQQYSLYSTTAHDTRQPCSSL